MPLTKESSKKGKIEKGNLYCGEELVKAIHVYMAIWTTSLHVEFFDS